MDVSRTSAVEHALFIPELLGIIFRMSDQYSNAQNAQVCKAWSATALDVLWSKVDDICRLFSLLAPLTTNPEGNGRIMEFQKIPDVDCWKKFERYSFRVRQLTYVHHRGVTLSRSAFDIVARTRLRLDILPNMHSLDWDGPVDLAVIFMHSGVKNFEMWLPNRLDAVSLFLTVVALQMPVISNLNIKSGWSVMECEADLFYLITQLSKLHTINFPQYFFTTKVMEALSRLPNLGVINFNYSSQRCGNKDDVMPFTPRLDEGAFPTLCDLSLPVSFDEISRFLDHKFFPKRLTYLYVDSGIIETGEFLCVVAENCPLLQVLYLISSSDSDVEPIEIAPCKITTDQLKPLFKLTELKSVQIEHYYPLALKMEDIDLLATSLRSLEKLVLNNEPVRLRQSELTLEALLPFANHCPNLVHLGLFVDASCSKIPPPQLIPPLPSFKRLKLLSMGVSIIDDDQSPAIYLSQILPLGCKVDQDETWRIGGVDRNARWIRVSKLLPALIQLYLNVEEKRG